MQTNGEFRDLEKKYKNYVYLIEILTPFFAMYNQQLLGVMMRERTKLVGQGVFLINITDIFEGIKLLKLGTTQPLTSEQEFLINESVLHVDYENYERLLLSVQSSISNKSYMEEIKKLLSTIDFKTQFYLHISIMFKYNGETHMIHHREAYNYDLQHIPSYRCDINMLLFANPIKINESFKRLTNFVIRFKKELEKRNKCLFCYKKASSKCKTCSFVYCSTECQQIDWSSHKRVCKILSKINNK